MKIIRRTKKPHVTSKESYKHIIGNNGEDIQEYNSSSSYSKVFSEPGILRAVKKDNPNMQINDQIRKTDFKNGNYLKGIKHSFIVSNKTREQFKNGTYGTNK
jgi:hypothetical protein